MLPGCRTPLFDPNDESFRLVVLPYPLYTVLLFLYSILFTFLFPCPSPSAVGSRGAGHIFVHFFSKNF